jgi:GNAT superfamily N-acetyltransferase
MTSVERFLASPPGAVVVAPADQGPNARAFVTLPYRIHHESRCWVPPLRGEERRRWSARTNASLRTRWVRRFIALRGGAVVGRIAAIVDEAFASRWEPRAGWFGFFECLNDPGAARALLGMAERALAARGRRTVVGPINLTTHDETGILTDGFDSPPMVQSPYNPPYYAELLEAAGYTPFREYHSYLWTPSGRQLAAESRVRVDVADKIEHSAITIRPMRLREWDAETRTVFELYNASFADVWGFVPIGWEEFRQRAALFRRFLVPDLALIAEAAGRPVGFALTLPDINAALRPLHGRLWPLGWLRLARAVPRLRSGRFILLGVRPDWAGRRIGALLAAETAAALRRLGYRQVELSLVQGANDRVRKVIEAFGCPRLKSYTLFRRELQA